MSGTYYPAMLLLDWMALYGFKNSYFIIRLFSERSFTITSFSDQGNRKKINAISLTRSNYLPKRFSNVFNGYKQSQKS